MITPQRRMVSLAVRYGGSRIFTDFNNIRPGVDFRDHVEEALSQSDVVLAVIGPGWLYAGDRDGKRRMDDPEDLVRSELSKRWPLRRRRR